MAVNLDPNPNPSFTLQRSGFPVRVRLRVPVRGWECWVLSSVLATSNLDMSHHQLRFISAVLRSGSAEREPRTHELMNLEPRTEPEHEPSSEHLILEL